MTGKLLGALALLGVALWVLYTVLRQQRQQTALLRELGAALEAMASAVRWQQRTLPDILREMARYPVAGTYFQQVCQLLDAGFTLRRAWETVFAALPAGGDLMVEVELSGDGEKLTDALLYTAGQLKKRCEQQRGQQRQTTKLWCAGVLSGTGLLIILLI